MSAVGSVLYNVLFLFLILLLVRVVMETVFRFARCYEPHGVALLVLEAAFTVTDPPVKALRRMIPPLRLGQIAHRPRRAGAVPHADRPDAAGRSSCELPADRVIRGTPRRIGVANV